MAGLAAADRCPIPEGGSDVYGRFTGTGRRAVTAVLLSKDMGVTHAECRRVLPLVVPDARLTWQGTRGRAEWPDRSLEIELGPERVRRIASLCLPRVEVTLRFHGFSDRQRQDLLARFNRRFQRAGG